VKFRILLILALTLGAPLMVRAETVWFMVTCKSDYSVRVEVSGGKKGERIVSVDDYIVRDETTQADAIELMEGQNISITAETLVRSKSIIEDFILLKVYTEKWIFTTSGFGSAVAYVDRQTQGRFR
jgi:hypothetical protein